MKNRKIVRRIFTIDNGEKCDKTMYLASPKDILGVNIGTMILKKRIYLKMM